MFLSGNQWKAGGGSHGRHLYGERQLQTDGNEEI